SRQAPILEPLEERRSRDAELARNPLAIVVVAPQRALHDLALQLLEHLLQAHAGRKLGDRDPHLFVDLQVEGEIRGFDRRALPQEQGAVDGVAQLADVSRPMVALQPLDRRRAEANRIPARRERAEEMLRQLQDVAAAVSQRWQVQWNDAEPIVEI